jgi:hypothetical protein
MWGKHPPGLFRSSNPNSQPQLHFGLHRVVAPNAPAPQHLPSINHATDRLDPRVIRTPSHHAKLRPCGSQSVWAGLLFISGVGRQYSRCILRDYLPVAQMIRVQQVELGRWWPRARDLGGG